MILAGGSPALDREVLLALYWSSGGPRWKNKRGWEENDPHLGHWHGVTLDGHGRVMRLDLNNNSLEGGSWGWPLATCFVGRWLMGLDVSQKICWRLGGWAGR